METFQSNFQLWLLKLHASICETARDAYAPVQYLLEQCTETPTLRHFNRTMGKKLILIKPSE